MLGGGVGYLTGGLPPIVYALGIIKIGWALGMGCLTQPAIVYAFWGFTKQLDVGGLGNWSGNGSPLARVIWQLEFTGNQNHLVMPVLPGHIWLPVGIGIALFSLLVLFS